MAAHLGSPSSRLRVPPASGARNQMPETRLLVKFRMFRFQNWLLRYFHNGSAWFCVEESKNKVLRPNNQKKQIENKCLFFIGFPVVSLVGSRWDYFDKALWACVLRFCSFTVVFILWIFMDITYIFLMYFIFICLKHLPYIFLCVFLHLRNQE